MNFFGIRKSLLSAVLFFVIPVGGLLTFHYTRPDPSYSVMLSLEEGKPVIGECTEVAEFETYLEGLNEANKSKNIVCSFSGMLTTMSKGIQCNVMHGATVAYFYWAESSSECERVKNTLQK